MAGDAKSPQALDHAFNLLDQFTARTVPDHYISRAHYYRANIWSARRQMSADAVSWTWKSEAIDNEILELRKAIRHPGFNDLNRIVQAQIYTNTGNCLNHIGRFIEAIEYWDRALKIIPGFAMAWGNRGLGLKHYAGVLYDPGHQDMFMLFSFHSFGMACDERAVLDNPDNLAGLHFFSQQMEMIGSYYNIPYMNEKLNLDDYSMGRSNKEKDYRQWCLDQRLFINPLNDLGPYPIAAQDITTLPSITVGVEDGPGPPAVIHYFNILKQEFCSARFAMFEGMTTTGVHYSDRRVLLYNTWDYPTFGFAIERMKMAFRGAYAVFDKIAFILNSYLSLGHSDTNVNFKNVWFKGNGRSRVKTLHPSLDGMANWSLRGLYWLSKDIFEEEFKEATEPDAQLLYELRNHLEHKFVTVHDSFFSSVYTSQSEQTIPGKLDISIAELTSKTVRQLKLARAGIIYLTLAVHAEEQRRAQEKGDDIYTFPMILDELDDGWKRKD